MALLLGCLMLPGWAAAQEPELFDRARAELAAHDTVAALETLRRLTDERPDYAPGWGLLGEVLTERASSVATDFQDRSEAEKALRRALELDHDHPLYLFTLGQLKRKQQIYLDSRRLIDRAIDRLEEGVADLDPAEEAELWFQRGLFYEDEYLDTHHLVFAPNLPVGGMCAIAPTFCMNFTDPKQFNEHLRTAADLSQFGEDDYQRMANAFGKALEADSSHAGAFRRLAIHRVDRGDLAGAEELARAFIAGSPASPWGYLTLGLVYHRSDRDSLAEIEFERGLERARPEIAAHYGNIAAVLREEQAESYSQMNQAARRRLEAVLWRKSDPLYLSPENEVRVAHLARVAFADLMFEDPTEGAWGSETEQGALYVRYGAPKRVFKVRRDSDKELSEAELQEALSGVASSNTDIRVGGRWIFWNYGWELPNFIFVKNARWRHISHLGDTFSATFDEDLRELTPAVYETDFDIHDYAAQFARFRGASDSIIELDIYSLVPAAELLEGVAADSVRLGLFLFAGPEHERAYERTLSVPADGPEGGRPLTYTLPLPAGRFSVSIEARAGTGAAAVRRESVELAPFRSGQLALSDLVLARTVTPRLDRVSERDDFAIHVNRELVYERHDPFALYWEVYGLSPDAEGLARYRVTLSVRSAEGKGVLARVVGALGGLVGLSGEQEPELTFERVVEPAGDRVPEYMSLELALSEAGDYRIRVEVTDQVSGAVAVSERDFSYVEPTEED